jgi:hypothetical protein
MTSLLLEIDLYTGALIAEIPLLRPCRWGF